MQENSFSISAGVIGLGLEPVQASPVASDAMDGLAISLTPGAIILIRFIHFLSLCEFHAGATIS
jgi:hypothetical protein